ncbi:MAG: hypothetical protein JJ863_29725 [Deltaproteobacteria bacterium]|nr:hypothetical protein [Deltaproteobacteria bacterium]
MSWSRMGIGAALAWLLATPAHAQEAEVEDAPLEWASIEPTFADASEEPAPDPKDDEPATVVAVVDSEGEPVDAEVRARVNVNVAVAVHDGDAEGDGQGEEEPASSGHHFFAEASAGLMLTPGFGSSSHLLVGAGGRRPGGFLRFYAIGGLAHASVTSSHQRDGLRYEHSRHHLDVIAGLRIYVPVVGPVRLFTDFLGGGSHMWSSLEGGTFGEYRAQGWRPVFIWAAGLQVRVTQELSVGGRFALRSTSDPLEDLHEHVGETQATGLMVDLGATVSWHF